MRRNLLNTLLDWKIKKKRKPLIVLGARQVGKTYLLEKLFGEKEFEHCYKFDFKENRGELHDCFKNDLNPQAILTKLQLLIGQDIDLKNSLILFDEIQECPRALTSLKYFNEKMPQIYLCATGSYLGLNIKEESYPVGQVETHNLFPLSFDEFLMASNQKKLIEHFNKQSRLDVLHKKLWDQLTDYYFVGGLPEVVDEWFKSEDVTINKRIHHIHDLQKELLSAYKADFGKHSGKYNALHIEAVFENCAKQLAKPIDGSVKRFRFKDVVSGKKNYQDLFGPIEWLVKAGLCYKVFVIDTDPRLPLQAIAKENLFKLYLFDVGILGHILDISYKEQKDQNCFIAKGFFAENFVLTEMKSLGMVHPFAWKGKSSEIEFIQKSKDNYIFPIEVKSGARTTAKSLKAYKEKYSPQKTLKLVGKMGGVQSKDLVMPLYYTKNIIRQLCF